MRAPRAGRVVGTLALFGGSVLFGWSGIGKFIDPAPFRAAMLAHEVVPFGLVGVAEVIVPSAEVALGVAAALALTRGLGRHWVLLLEASAVAVFLVYLGAVLLWGGGQQRCGCVAGDNKSVQAGLWIDGAILLVVAISFWIEVRAMGLARHSSLMRFSQPASP